MEFDGCTKSEAIRRAVDAYWKKYIITRFGYKHRSQTDLEHRRPTKFDHEKAMAELEDSLLLMSDADATAKLIELGYIKPPRPVTLAPELEARIGKRWMRFVVGPIGSTRALMQENVKLVDDGFVPEGKPTLAMSWQEMIVDIKSKKIV